MVLSLVIAGGYLWISRKGAAEPPLQTKPLERPWRGPPLGTVFGHCGIACVVVGHGFSRGEVWHAGVVANYADQGGKIRVIFIPAHTWDKLKPAPITQKVPGR